MKKSQSGFSLVEVMLTLAIMFVLFVALIGMVQFSLGRQRYESTLNSFKDFLQRQYSEVQNVVIDGEREEVKECNHNNSRVSTMGRTNCYVIGRLLNFRREKDGQRTLVDVYQIVYKEDNANDPQLQFLMSNDFSLTDAYNQDKIKGFHGYKVDEYAVEWGALLKRPIPNASPEINGNLSVFIFRSPESGAIRTYISDGREFTPTTIGGILSKNNLEKTMDICVISSGSAGTELRSVRINAGSPNASGIEITLPQNLLNGGKCE